ncbi:hypothetical protein ACVNT8_004236 [Enterobacter cloacae]
MLKNGVLTESAIDSVDPAILSLFSQRPLALHRGIGYAMAVTGLTDALCRWRINILLSADLLKMEEGVISLCSPA